MLEIFRCYDSKNRVKSNGRQSLCVEPSAVHIEDCELVAVWLLWLIGRAAVAQARGVLGMSPDDC